jgi:plastocyanin
MTPDPLFVREGALIVRWLLALGLTSLASAASAGDVSVVLRTPQGAPIADAVVTVAATRPGPIRFAWPYVMAQQNMTFDPFVLVVPVGAEVSFPNRDAFRHHVYSFSRAKTFELKLYPRGAAPVVKFERPGVVLLGCNIHDDMIAFIDVVDTPFAAKTDAQGRAVIHDVPEGAQTITVWRPYLHAPGNALAGTVSVPRDGAAAMTFAAEVRTPPMRHAMY